MTTLNELINTYGIEKLMSMVKYPSILTYHNLGERGMLLDSLVDNKDFNDQLVYITEKIDGTNSFMCFTTDVYGRIDDYFIGSRTEPLYFKGDRMIVNHSQCIADNLKAIADNVCSVFSYARHRPAFNSLWPFCIYVVFGETYGGKINGYKEYGRTGKYGFRVFDIIEMPLCCAKKVLEMDIEHISSWRESGQQPFVNVDRMVELCGAMEMPSIVPFLKVGISGDTIPTSIEGVYDWLQQFKDSRAKLDDDGLGHAEGVVVRTFNRTLIRKIRFEDYQRTLKRKTRN